MSTWREAGMQSVPESFRAPIRRAEPAPLTPVIVTHSPRPVYEAGKMNKLETKYAQYLENRRLVGEIESWKFEQVKLKLADRTFYTPDFWVVMPNRTVEAHEVKGFWEDDARVKVKVAAREFPEVRFLGIRWLAKYGWKFEEF